LLVPVDGESVFVEPPAFVESPLDDSPLESPDFFGVLA
jgi:hypothetical protein